MALFQLKRGTPAALASEVVEPGECILDTTNNAIVTNTGSSGAAFSTLKYFLGKTLVEWTGVFSHLTSSSTTVHSQYSPTNHTHTAYSPTNHTHTAYSLTEHTHTAYSPTNHTHTAYSLTEHTHTAYSPTEHTHTAYSSTAHTHTATANTWTAQQTFKELKDTVHTITDGASFQIDPGNGSVQIVTLAADRTPAATNFEAGQTVLLGINAGAFSVTWNSATFGSAGTGGSAGVLWNKVGGSAVAPELATTGTTWVLLWKVGSQVNGSEAVNP